MGEQAFGRSRGVNMSITVLCSHGNVEIIVDGVVVHSVPFAAPKLLAAYKGDT